MASLPVRGAWIEIPFSICSTMSNGSLPVRGAWIEIRLYTSFALPVMSLPVRGAWIEIEECRLAAKKEYVAPRAGSVD